MLINNFIRLDNWYDSFLLLENCEWRLRILHTTRELPVMSKITSYY